MRVPANGEFGKRDSVAAVVERGEIAAGEHLADHVAEDRYELAHPTCGLNDDLLIFWNGRGGIVEQQLGVWILGSGERSQAGRRELRLGIHSLHVLGDELRSQFE